MVFFIKVVEKIYVDEAVVLVLNWKIVKTLRLKSEKTPSKRCGYLLCFIHLFTFVLLALRILIRLIFPPLVR